MKILETAPVFYLSTMLYNGDCFDLMKTLPDKSVDLIVTDPPYNISIGGGGFLKEKNAKYALEKQLKGIDKGYDLRILDECVRVMKAINIYIFCSHFQIVPLLQFFVQERDCSFNLITWHKTNPMPYCGNTYLKDTEYCLFFRKRGVKVYGTFDTKKTYYLSSINYSDKKKYKHPTIKPLNIIQNFIINSSRIGDVVLDPFMGSGTTGVAATQLNRKFIGIELSKEYFEIAKNRIEESERFASDTKTAQDCQLLI